MKVIAIDGPAGSGKGTVSKILATKLNYVYIDTGAMYRAIAYMALKNNILDDEEKIVDLAKNSKIEFKNNKVFINNIDVTDNIRTIEVSKITSPISSIVKLREVLVEMQRNMAKNSNIIMEGRDITTVVFPNANVKIYLDANLEERARRRYNEMIEKGISTTYEEVLDNISQRDYNDMHKEVGSLTRVKDSIYIDSTNMSIDDVVNQIIDIVNIKNE